MKGKTKWIYLLVAVVFAFSCEKLFPPAPADNELLDGPIEGLTEEQLRLFALGDAAFNDQVFHPGNGLGPLFVATSCGSCHPGDGKGHPFSTLTRFGQTDSTGNYFLEQGGPQLQHRAIPGFMPESIPQGATSARFTPPINTGLGYLEAMDDATLFSMQDVNDVDGDGISGVVNWISLPPFVLPSSNNISQNGKYIGRFGKKAGAFSLLHQTVNAYIQDIGISSEYHPQDLFHYQNGAAATDGIADPEVSAATVNNVVFYLQTLKSPIPRNEEDAYVQAGKNIFVSLGCEKCHRETLVTGNSPISVLANKEFHPYTDLLLHDMGSQLDDGYTEGSALTYEWRTPPLWGLGLATNSQGGEYFLMHDGRALSIDEAIQLHGGEAESSKQQYNQLTESEKEQLIAFLESL